MVLQEQTEILIIGNGFAGMNLGRILAKQMIKSTIISNGYGASNLWAGSFDFLKSLPKNPAGFEEGIHKFTQKIPDHPYSHIPTPVIKEGLDDFFSTFPDFYAFKNQDNYYNGSVLTLLGQDKPCLGLWNSIFYEFDNFSSDSVCFLVEFQEFNNSAMNLVCKGLQERYEGTFSVLSLSLGEIFKKIDPKMLEKLNDNRLTVNNISKFFEINPRAIEYLGYLLNDQFANQVRLPPIDSPPIFLFPPILGIENTTKILNNLSEFIGANCYELVSLSPSAMATRLSLKMESSIEKKFCSIQKGYTLSDVKYQGDGKGFLCLFENQKGIKSSVVTQKLVLATGSVFLSGFSADNSAIAKFIKGKPQGLHFCGSACYLSAENISDEDEIRFGTGLGLAVVTSYHVGQKIIKRQQP